MFRMSDDEFVEQAAREYVQRHGTNSVGILRDRAEMADELGDVLSAEAWRDIADAAERTLREGPSEP